MRLYGSKTSPFVRNARIVVGELGLEDKVEFVLAEGTPMDEPGLRAKNPLRKIPFIETAGGEILFDSRVVIEALLQAADANRAEAYLPSGGPGRLEVLTRQALSVGMMDVAVGMAYELRLRPAEKHWSEWLDVQWSKVVSALDWQEAAARPEGRFDLGDCALAAGLIYLDLRYGDRDWRAGRPNLAAWFESAKARPAVAAVLN